MWVVLVFLMSLNSASSNEVPRTIFYHVVCELWNVECEMRWAFESNHREKQTEVRISSRNRQR